MARPACGVILGVFRFAFLRTYVFISDQGVKAGGSGGEGCMYLSPFRSQGSCVGSFLLCFACPP